MSIKSTLGLSPPPTLTVARDEAVLLQVHITGTQYYQLDQAFDSLKVGQVLTLQREPFNAFDGRAVAVYWRKYKLGFIPKSANYSIALLLDQQVTLKAVIAEIRPQQDWQSVLLQVCIVGVKRG